jgi:chromosome segregation ATPase
MQIDELTLKLQDSTTANATLKQREKSLLTKLKNFKSQLATVKQQNETLTSRLKKAKASIRLKAREVASAKSTIISLGVLLGASVLTSAVLIFVS